MQKRTRRVEYLLNLVISLGKPEDRDSLISCASETYVWVLMSAIVEGEVRLTSNLQPNTSPYLLNKI